MEAPCISIDLLSRPLSHDMLVTLVMHGMHKCKTLAVLAVSYELSFYNTTVTIMSIANFKQFLYTKFSLYTKCMY